MTRRRQAILLIYLTLGAFFVAHSLNAFVSQALVRPVTNPVLPVATAAPAQSPVTSARLAEEILNSGLFAAARSPGRGPESPAATQPLKPLDAAKRIKVMGTVIGEGVSALAVLEDMVSKRQLLYHLYDRIPDVGQIVEIRRDGIMVKEGEQQEFLSLAVALPGLAVPVAMAATPTPTSPSKGLFSKGHLSVDRQFLAQNMSDVPQLLTQAQALPFYQDGKLTGWKIESIKPGSVYEKIGLLAGDVLQRVNGVEIRDPGMMLTLFQQVKNENQVKVDLIRASQKTTLTYDIR